MEVLEMSEGDTMEVSYDIFQSVVSDLAKLKKILFVFEDYVKANTLFKKQSEALLSMFEIPVE
jgi:hypothetical protein